MKRKRKIKLSENELIGLIEKIIKENDAPSTNNIKIDKIKKSEIYRCIDVVAKSFSHVMGYDDTFFLIRSLKIDWNLSYKASIDNVIVGCYLLNEGGVEKFEKCSLEDLTPYKNLKGIEGVVLAVLPEYRSFGIGKILREIPKKLGYDYIWGQQFKFLGNLEDWTRFGRRLVADCGDINITLMDIKKKGLDLSKHHTYQEKGYTCGPTCIEMVSKFLGVDYGHVDDISDLCGCNPKTGTVDTGMKNALDNLGINSEQNRHTSSVEDAMDYLDELLEKGNIFIMRTLTRGIKHWIIVYGKQKDDYLIADPWLGNIEYDFEDIVDIWEPRNFDGFEVKL